MTAFDDDTLRVDFAQREVTVDGHPVHLNPKEYLLLATLVSHPDQPVSVPELLALFWVEDPSTAASTAVRAYVAGLRHELAGHGPGDYSAIVTVSDGCRYRSLTS